VLKSLFAPPQIDVIRTRMLADTERSLLSAEAEFLRAQANVRYLADLLQHLRSLENQGLTSVAGCAG